MPTSPIEMENKAVIFHKALVAVLATVLLGICVSFGVILFQTNRELEVLEAKQAEYRQALVEKNSVYQARHAYLKKMLTDVDFFEKVVRERLGYSRENEIIFRFPEN